MKTKTKKKMGITILIVSLVFLIICVLLILFRQLHTEPATENYIQYKDNISELTILDSNSQNYQLDTKQYKLMVYLSNECGNCIDSLPVLNEINKIFCSDNLEMFLLWENKIPEDKVKQNNLLDNSYSLNNVSISSSLDTVFLVDEMNNVVFVDSNGYENALLFLIDEEIVNTETLVDNSNEFILENYAEQSSLPNLVYFSMPGCPDCEKADDVVSSSEIQNAFNITRIERDKNASEDDIVDKLGIFKMVYGIDWYPSFLILRENGDHSIIGKIEPEKLKQTLMESASYCAD